MRFIKLQMLQHGTGAGEDDDEAFVAFMVRFKFRNQAGQRQGGTRVEQITERRWPLSFSLSILGNRAYWFFLTAGIHIRTYTANGLFQV